MNWEAEAEAAIRKVPFFVRKKVRQRVESEASSAGRTHVSLADVRATQKRYLNRMSSEIKGYQLDACFGPSGCPNRAARSDRLVERIEACLASADLLSFLTQQIGDRLKFHHEFRVTVAECPNACSQPQIKDIGIIGVQQPVVTNESCSNCGECIEVCPDAAITMSAADRPEVDAGPCMRCGKCIGVCPTGAIANGRCGYTVLLGGKLGRHPRLAAPLPDIYDEDEVLEIVKTCLDFYKARSRKGRRFGEILTAAEFKRLTQKFHKIHGHREGEGLSC